MDGWTDGRKEINPSVLQDIGPLGPLPKMGGVEFCGRKKKGGVNKAGYAAEWFGRGSDEMGQTS